MDQGSGDGADDDSYQHNGGDDENHETLAGLVLECLLFHRVYLAIALEGMDGIHENSVAVSVARGGDLNQRRCNRDILFNISFLGALESSPIFSLLFFFLVPLSFLYAHLSVEPNRGAEKQQLQKLQSDTKIQKTKRLKKKIEKMPSPFPCLPFTFFCLSSPFSPLSFFSFFTCFFAPHFFLLHVLSTHVSSMF